MDENDRHVAAKKFRERLKQLRERNQWTQSELAEHAQVSVVTISKLEQGKNLPTFEVLIALCSAIGVSPTELIGWSAGSDETAPELLVAERVAKALRKMPDHQASALLEFTEKLAKG